MLRTLGVEEEVLLVDERTGVPVPVAEDVLRASAVDDQPFALAGEMHREMLELIGPPHSELADLRSDVAEARVFADDAARSVGARAVPLAVSPLAADPHPSPTERYGRMMRRYGLTPLRSMTCGMHVHVAIGSAAEGVAVLDRLRVWLPVLRALAANSPYADGLDTGHESYRFVRWSQWPASGPAEIYGDVTGYEAATAELMKTGALLDEGMLYADARLSTRFPTVEVRVADVPLSAQTTATLAGLVRGLVSAAADAAARGEAPPRASSNAVRLASAEASLNGLTSTLVDPRTGCPAPAEQVVHALFRYAEPGLARHGDLDTVAAGVEMLLCEGNGAQWQRHAVRRGADLGSLVRAAADCSYAEAREHADAALFAGA